MGRSYSQTFKAMLNAQKGGKAEVNREFLRRLLVLLRIMVPSWKSKEFFLFLLQTFFLVGRTVTSVYVAKLDGYIVKALVSAQYTEFLWGLVYWLIIGNTQLARLVAAVASYLIIG